MDIELEKGIHAYPVEFGTPNPLAEQRGTKFPLVDEARAQLDALLRSISEQRGEFKGFVTLDTCYKDGDVISGFRSATTTFVVVEKASGGIKLI